MLPRPFDALTIDDLPEILERAGDDRETLFFERKAEASPESLAKSCAAFANTMGGIVVVGVRDDDDTPVGIECRAAEPQVWVKDMLRGHLLPIPPFRARWLPLEGDVTDRAVLVVMVAESSTTPHILTRRGAIYIRNPGSSDPAPIADQRLLYSLMERGERSQLHATSEALKSVSDATVDPLKPWQIIAAVPTGVADNHRSQLFTPAGASRLLKVLYDVYGEGPRRPPSWPDGPFYDQKQVHYRRWSSPGLRRRFELVAASDDGLIAVGHRLNEEVAVLAGELTGHVERVLRAARNFALDLGGHGDLMLAWRFILPEPARVHVGEQSTSKAIDAIIERPASLDPDPDRDTVLLADMVSEVVRAGGLGPSDDAP